MAVLVVAPPVQLPRDRNSTKWRRLWTLEQEASWENNPEAIYFLWKRKWLRGKTKKPDSGCSEEPQRIHARGIYWALVKEWATCAQMEFINNIFCIPLISSLLNQSNYCGCSIPVPLLYAVVVGGEWGVGDVSLFLKSSDWEQSYPGTKPEEPEVHIDLV